MSRQFELTIVYEPGEGGLIRASIPEVAGVFGEGQSREEARTNAIDALGCTFSSASTAISQSAERELLRLTITASSDSDVGAIEGLRETWSRYPEEWSQRPTLRLGYTGLGEEWGGPLFADVLIGLVERYLGPDVDVLELGCGGGKFSRRLAPKCRSLLCTDISPEMIAHTRSTLRGEGIGENVEYAVLNGMDFDGVPRHSVDFIFSYDVQLHLQPENVFSYMQDARRVLREDGVMMVHQLNLATPRGCELFLSQYRAGTWKYESHDLRRRGYMHFMDPRQMRMLANAAQLEVDDLIVDFPPAGPSYGGGDGRDVIGFLRAIPSRLRDCESTRLVRAEGTETVYAILDNKRAAFPSAHHFLAAGCSFEMVEVLSTDALTQFPELEPLALWECESAYCAPT